MREFITKNFFQLFIIILIGILFLQKCGEPIEKHPVPIVKIDTMFIVKDSVVFVRPQLMLTSRDTTIYQNTVEYVPSDNYEVLLEQFEELKSELLSKNTYSDTLKLDSGSYVAVVDNIQKNLITDRVYNYKITYPNITKTITNPYIPKNQFYLGGEILGNKNNILNAAEVNLLFKNKKDRIFGAKVQKEFNSTPVSYGISSYWKIKLKK